MASAGQRNKQIVLKKPIHTPNSSGEVITTYVTAATVWGAVEWNNGRLFEAAKKLNAEVSGVITIVYRTDIKADWQIGYGNRTITIISLANVKEQNRELVIWCKEAK